MNSTTLGLGLVGLAELSKRDSVARGNDTADGVRYNRLMTERNQIVEEANQFIFRAKSQVHGMRSSIYGHRIVEDQLIAALKAENANHPLASREAVDAAVKDECARALVNPEVIKKTYPDGNLPDGAITPPNLVQHAV